MGPTVWRVLALALAAAAAAAQPTNGTNGGGGGGGGQRWTEISSSIVLAVPSDYLLDGSGRSKCMDMVERASQLNVKRLQFVPTTYWVDKGPLNPPPGFDTSCKNADFLNTFYCYNRFNATEVSHWCYDRDACAAGPPQRWEVDRFRGALQACMQLATSRGHDLSVNLHVDDATRGGLGGWRNTLNFAPTAPYSGVSYVDAVLDPIADAIAGAMKADTQVWITMQGEMGATVFYHPQEWQRVAGDLRSRIGGSTQNGRVHIGVGLNNAKLSGSILVPIVDQREYLRQFPAAFEAVKGDFDLPAIQQFFKGGAIDYVGLSAYIPQARVDFQPCDLEGLMSRLDEEFAFYGVTLRQLVDMGKEIHWVETGVGGGVSPTGDKKATTAEEAAYTPFFGMAGPYSRANDPFILYDLAQPSPVRDYARRFYTNLAAYLARGGCEYFVAHVCIWNLPSWDVQALYPISTTSEGSYRDPAIVQTINDHNARRG